MANPKRHFTSVVALLMKAGHEGMMIKLVHPVGNAIRKGNIVWFPGLQLVMEVDSNKSIQLQQDGEGRWIYRRGRKNHWYEVSALRGGVEFINLIGPHYVKYINDLMVGDKHVP